MSDKFWEAKKEFIKETAEYLAIPHDHVKRVYSRMEDVGLIDYDIEKDIFLNGEEE